MTFQSSNYQPDLNCFFLDAVERDEMVLNICKKLLEKEWRAYDVENIPRGIEDTSAFYRAPRDSSISESQRSFTWVAQTTSTGEGNPKTLTPGPRTPTTDRGSVFSGYPTGDLLSINASI